MSQLDHKDRGADPSTASTEAGVHHFVLASFTAVALLAIYILINTPSASVDNSQISKLTSEAVNNEFNSQFSGIDLSAIQFESFNTTVRSDFSLEPVDITEASMQFHQDVIGGNMSPLDLSEVKPQFQPSEFLQSQPWIAAKVKKRDTLTQIFERNGLGSSDAIQLAQLDESAPLLKIRPGQEIKLKIGENGSLGQLEYKLNKFETLNILKHGDGFITQVVIRDPEIRINNAKATIQHSLLGAAEESGVSANTMYEFIAMFGWQVDFAMDIRTGDQFSIIFEELFLDDEKVGNGKIIAAELLISGKKLQAIRHTDEDGMVNYYAPNGDGVKGTFLRTPMKFGNITSNFSKNRLHPIKKIWTAHKGVDYGAPRGTPVLATGNGTVKQAGRLGGYGKTIIIRHGGKYETVYAHLSGYAEGIKSGARVQQGDVIGYVGSTGMATGPHLHYEFRVHGVHMNPVTVEFPKSEPIPDKYRDNFQLYAGIWVSELDHLNRIPIALNLIRH